MKIFAKRRKPSNQSVPPTSKTENTPTPEVTNVQSYFDNVAQNEPNLSPKEHRKSQKKVVVTDINLLLKMDPDTLNAKQRRLIRREEERQNQARTQETKEFQKNDQTTTKTEQNESPAQSLPSEIKNALKENGMKNSIDKVTSSLNSNRNPNTSIETSPSSAPQEQNQNQTVGLPPPPSLEGLNSKDRRKALRQYERQIESLALKSNQEESPILSEETLEPSINDLKALPDQEQKSLEVPAPPSLEGLNSKDRRKALREYERQIESIKANENGCTSNNSSSAGVDQNSKNTTSKTDKTNNTENTNKSTESINKSQASILASLKEEARKIAQRNQKVEETKKKPKKRNNTNSTTAEEPLPSSLQPPSSRKKQKIKDWSHLPPEERERREIQRKMQQEAAQRRAMEADGNVSMEKKRHPLNSERRRANRRKPGKAGLIAARKKQERLARSNPNSGNNRAALASYNVEGFRKRKGLTTHFEHDQY